MKFEIAVDDCMPLLDSRGSERKARAVLGAGGTEVVTKIRSPQITGEECPRPGTSAFHLMCSVSLQVSGASPRAMPFQSGPRHWAQSPGPEADASPAIIGSKIARQRMR